MMKKEAGFGGEDGSLGTVPSIAEFEGRTSDGRDENTSESI